ncbi:MAG: phytanoyl-CoA dioxygenase family protein [Anaerolineaceae bacterium]|nr:phytanoyl-CoA dioxygenase family protein [Anaerolineaceae bacterium]
MSISPQQIEQFNKEGYFIIENAVTGQQLEMLRRECQRYVDAFEAEMERLDVNRLGISHYKKRYFIDNRGYESAEIADFLTSELMTDVCRSILGDEAYLYNEQYVVKVADVGTKFGWHQDSGYIDHYHDPFLTCWVALDDMTVENGTLYVLPYERAKMHPTDLFEHMTEDQTNDKVGYYGDDPGIPVLVPAGSMVVFSSRLFHRSGANQSHKMRRAYEAHYSAKPIMDKHERRLQNKAVPVLQKGQRVVPAGSGV